jgi:hypothetical protein
MILKWPYLFLDSNFDDFFVDFDLPVRLQRVKVVVRHLVELGVGDVIQRLQDFPETGSLLRIISPARFHLEKV